MLGRALNAALSAAGFRVATAARSGADFALDEIEFVPMKSARRM